MSFRAHRATIGLLVNFGLEDEVFAVEEFSFGDGVRTASETLNPVVNPPNANAREVVFIQPIVAANSNGSNQAEFFGKTFYVASMRSLAKLTSTSNFCPHVK